ncbi:hypothetical protein ATY39_00565 [Rummeliibacillus stabekisii]|uniref:Response regulatory domain-containing protein n=2 Tax=Rummeliibacillus stabekisii TaxID=241244 RepID=A0A143H8H5_9BACL|nr:hypothetical protein ATY39_00565 [Rummeliibacillus stabekisii]
MRVMLIDDEEISLNVTEMTLKEFDDVNVVGRFMDPYAALKIMETSHVDIVFLDIEMGDVHGIHFASLITKKFSHVQIIMVTAHPQYALEAFDVDAVDYLLKPINKKRLQKAIEKVRRSIGKSDANTMEDTVSFYAETLGGFNLVDNKQNPLKWRTKKVKELFLFLWMRKGIPVHKAIVMEKLWPDTNQEKTTSLLHTTVYQLRKKFKEKGVENAISFNNNHYTLNVSVRSDIKEIEKITQAQQLSPTDTEKLLLLYKGDFLEEEDFIWSLSLQHQVRQSVLRYLERCISVYKDSALVESCLKKMLDIDCYQEEYMYKLLVFYKQTKNVSEMKTYYKNIESRLEEELGIEVPLKIKELYQQTI